MFRLNLRSPQRASFQEGPRNEYLLIQTDLQIPIHWETGGWLKQLSTVILTTRY